MDEAEVERYKLDFPALESDSAHKIAYNYLVLRDIFHCLEYSDLKSLRFVCKFWNSILAPLLYAKSYATLDDSDKLQEYVNSLCNYEASSTECVNGHISHIKIRDINFMEDDLRTLEIFWNCWSTDLLTGLEIDLAPHHGSSILTMLLATRVFPYLTHLKIRILKFYDVKLYPNDDEHQAGCLAEGSNHGSNFPQLKSFSYTYYTFDGSEFNFPIKWQSTLEQFPHIQELLFTGVSTSELHEIMDAIWVLKSANPSNYKIMKFQVLSEEILPEVPDNAHLTKLAKLQLPLLSLHLEISPTIDEFVLESLLTKYGRTLKQLQLRKYPNPVYVVDQEPNELTDVIFMGLYNLETLDISDNFLPNLDFLLQLPSLKSLVLSNRNPSKLSETKMILDTSPMIQNPFIGLTALSIDENVSMSCFKRICSLFPFLQHLTLRMDDEMLRVLFGNLTELKSLHIISKVTDDDDDDGSGIWSPTKKPTCSDKGITGIPLRFMMWGNVKTSKNRINRMFPYIGDLPQLENLTIEMWGNYGVGVSNLSIYYGLLELPRLRRVKLVRTLVTEDGVDLLIAKGVKVTVIDW